MVFFTCNHCGESLKKAAVEKHYNTRCRNAPKNVSCMDCLKDFYGEDYAAHTKCITEAEKYSGKDYVAKESNNSGAKKQESWMDTIRAILDSNEYNLHAKERAALEQLQSVENVPRKEAKFHNFASKCMRWPKPLAQKVWNVLEKEQQKMKQTKQQQNGTAATKAEVSDEMQQNGDKSAADVVDADTEPQKKKSKKSKVKEDDVVALNADKSASKKSKKRKAVESDETMVVPAQELASVAVDPAAENNADNYTSNKKSKKNKPMDNDEVAVTAAKKSKKQKAVESDETMVVPAQELASVAVDPAAENNADNLTSKKKSKKNKPMDNAEVAVTAAKKSKKQKAAESEELNAELSDEPVAKKSKKSETVSNGKIAAGEQNLNLAEKLEDTSAKKKWKKKDKALELTQAENENVNNTMMETSCASDQEFQWSAVLENILAKHGADGIGLDKFKKRILKKYLLKLGVEVLTEKQAKRFEQKFSKNLNKCAAVQVVGDMVKAC